MVSFLKHGGMGKIFESDDTGGSEYSKHFLVRFSNSRAKALVLTI